MLTHNFGPKNWSLIPYQYSIAAPLRNYLQSAPIVPGYLQFLLIQSTYTIMSRYNEYDHHISSCTNTGVPTYPHLAKDKLPTCQRMLNMEEDIQILSEISAVQPSTNSMDKNLQNSSLNHENASSSNVYFCWTIMASPLTNIRTPSATSTTNYIRASSIHTTVAGLSLPCNNSTNTPPLHSSMMKMHHHWTHPSADPK